MQKCKLIPTLVDTYTSNANKENECINVPYMHFITCSQQITAGRFKLLGQLL